MSRPRRKRLLCLVLGCRGRFRFSSDHEYSREELIHRVNNIHCDRCGRLLP